jgi:hypothetical protein
MGGAAQAIKPVQALSMSNGGYRLIPKFTKHGKYQINKAGITPRASAKGVCLPSPKPIKTGCASCFTSDDGLGRGPSNRTTRTFKQKRRMASDNAPGVELGTHAISGRG